MDKKLKEYYEQRAEMMSSVAWKQLIEDIQVMFDEYNKVTSLNGSIENLNFKKGQLDILNWLLSIKTVSEKAYEELLNEEVL